MAAEGLTHEDLRGQLARGEFSPLYLLYGEEEFLSDEAATEIVDAALRAGGREFNLDVVSGAELDAKEIVAFASSFPMNADRRVVVVREADKLAATDLELLGAYCDRPSPSTCLVLVAPKPDLRKRPFVTIRRSGVAVESKPLYESQIPAWIGTRVKRQGREINGEACRLMSAYVGTSLREIQNELDKLAIYLGEKKSISADDVAALVGMSREYSIFELQRSIGARDIRKSTDILNHMIEAGESAPFIIVMLTGYFSALWKVHDARRERTSNRELAGVLRVNPYFVQEYVDASSRFPAAAVEEAFVLLAGADERLKTTMADPLQVLHQLLVRLLGAGQGATAELAG